MKALKHILVWFVLATICNGLTVSGKNGWIKTDQCDSSYGLLNYNIVNAVVIHADDNQMCTYNSSVQSLMSIGIVANLGECGIKNQVITTETNHGSFLIVGWTDDNLIVDSEASYSSTIPVVYVTKNSYEKLTNFLLANNDAVLSMNSAQDYRSGCKDPPSDSDSTTIIMVSSFGSMFVVTLIASVMVYQRNEENDEAGVQMSSHGVV